VLSRPWACAVERVDTRSAPTSKSEDANGVRMEENSM